jgi:energy-coupling factor transporter ATP-binding protein EcfA2
LVTIAPYSGLVEEQALTILQEIQKWSQGLPDWQQDAIRRLYVNRELSVADLDDLFAMAKTIYGIEDQERREAAKLAAAEVAAPQVPERLVQIVAIKNLVNVNALAEGQLLPIAPTGLTVIYGENGAGKSGYSRVLKKACRARSQAEPILPNARKADAKPGLPMAEFDVIADGTKMQLAWVGGHDSPEQLSEIAIFDSHCARAYLDNEGDFAYVPYGLDILEGLVKACKAVKAMATKEMAANRPNLEPFAVLSRTMTPVGRKLSTLSHLTKAKEIEDLAAIDDEDLAKLTTLNKALAEQDPKQKALALRNRASRFTGLANRIDAALATVDDGKVQRLHALVTKSNQAKQAAQLASKQFRETPGLLPGTGGEPWEVLFEAARAYATISHADHSFPGLPTDASCPLCQQPLGEDGVAKLVAFDTFIQQEAEKVAKSAKAAAKEAYLAVQNAALDLGIDEALGKELQEAFPDTFDDFVAFQKSMQERRAAAMQASGSAIPWESIAALPVCPSACLRDKAEALSKDAKSLEDAMNVKARAEMVIQQAELDARAKLAEIKSSVLEALEKLVHNAKLKACADGIVVTGISRKSTDLSEKMATQEVVDALNAELRALNVHELQVAMKPESPNGKTQYKLRLQLPGGGAPSAILSEGEQRSIAIASFLAEVKLGCGRGGVVFDDPVSSLDHRRRWHVAARLVQESKARQVIVFTHDVYFLRIVQQQAELERTNISTQCIGRGPAGFGIQTDRLPFDTLSTSKRVKALRSMQLEVARAYKANEEAEATRLSREAYSHLRMAWERGVEEVLLDNTIVRFDEGVSTQRLKGVVVEDADYHEVNAGMTKSSKFSGHDPAMAAQIPTPHPDELRDDIDRLESWRASVEARKATVQARRKQPSV